MSTIPTFKIALTDSSKAVTTNFILILWEINLRGLKVLKSLSILTALKSIESIEASTKLVTTIKKSNYDHVSRKYEFLFTQNPNAFFKKDNFI